MVNTESKGLLLASFKMTQIVLKSKRPYTELESVVLPCLKVAADMIHGGKEVVKKVVKYCPPFLLCFAFFRLFVPAGFARLSIVFTSAVYRCQLLGYVEFWQRMNGSHDLTVQFELPLYIFFRCC